MFLDTLKKIFLNNQKLVSNILFAFIAFFIFRENTFASTTEDANALIKWLNYVILVASTIVWVISSLISMLLHPGWVNGTIFWFETYLKEIWILVSNIVYLLFAFILITIAFMNIVWKWEWTWQLKQALPKFVVWVLIVPFTWFFVQFILSISAILTISMLNLPYDLLHSTDLYNTKIKTQRICTTYRINLHTKAESLPWFKEQLEKCDKTTIDKVLQWKWPNASAWWMSWSVFWLINIYTYSIMNIDSLDKLRERSAGKTLKTFLDIWIKLIIDVLFLIIFLIILVALFLALFSRWMRLWIHAMFSPIYWLFFFFGADKWWDVWKNMNPIEFMKLALVPVYVSAALSFGLIFMFVAAHGLSKDAWSGTGWIFGQEAGWGSSLNIWGFKLIIEWTVWDDKPETENLFNSLAWETWNALWQLILQLFGLAILWIAVMAALKQSEITNSVTQPIQDFGNKVWELMKNSPRYAPIIPTPNGMASASALSSVGNSVNQHFSNKWATQARDLLKGTRFWEAWKRVESEEKAYKLSQDYKANRKWTISALSDAMNNHSDFKTLMASEKIVDSMKNVANGIGTPELKALAEKATAWNESSVADLAWKLERALDREPEAYWGNLIGRIDGRKVRDKNDFINSFNRSSPLPKEKKDTTKNAAPVANGSADTVARDALRTTAVAWLKSNFKNWDDWGLKVWSVVINNNLTSPDDIKSVAWDLAKKDYIKWIWTVDWIAEAIRSADDDLDTNTAKEIAKAIKEELDKDHSWSSI